MPFTEPEWGDNDPSKPVTAAKLRQLGKQYSAARADALMAAAKNPDQIVTGDIVRNADQAIVSAAVTWPDGTPGRLTTDVFSSAFPGAIDAYRVTYGSPTVRTYVQPQITRNADGAATTVPAITIEGS